MNLKETTKFTISVIGDRTGEKWFGEFTCLRRLSHRSELNKDRIIRDLLGGDPRNASERALSQAEILAECQVSLIDAPSWWREAGNGLDLVDDSVIQAVYENIMKIKIEAIKEIQDKGKEAEDKLKELAEKK